MSYLFPGLFGLPYVPTPSTPVPSADASPTLSPAGVMSSTSLQFRNIVETEKLERTILKHLVQRLKKDFALLQPRSNYLISQSQLNLPH